MSALPEFVESLFANGEVTFTERPVTTPAERTQTIDGLRRAYRIHNLDLAGPELPFQEATALACAELLRRACWFLIDRTETPEVVTQALVLPPPRSPAEHWSADLVLRLLPVPLRRAQAIAADDPVAVQLTQIARQWPLSGVLTDIADAPQSPLEFGGHPGLLMLYAERLAENPKAAWVPEGVAYDYVELVFREAGKSIPARARGDSRESE
jgi:hypothetical protein